jgi:hypothetical protein
MALFRLFGGKKVANSDVIPMVVDNPQIENEETVASTEKDESFDKGNQFITITWGTGMPIDIIFNFIHKISKLIIFLLNILF